jgi:UDP-N-acetylglucosamine acyltransferase
LPFVRTVGNRARVYDLNLIGLERQGMSEDTITKLKGAFRYLLQSKLNTTQALEQIEQDETVQCAEVAYLVDFIRSSKRGVNLRRPSERIEAPEVEE